VIDTLYREKRSLLHAYDCRLKLVLLPLLVVYFFLPQGLPISAGVTSLLLILILAVLGWKDLVLPLSMIGPLLILILLLTPLFHRTGTPLVTAGSFLLVTSDGLTEAFQYALRLTGISIIFFLFFRTTPMEDILLALSWYRLPYTVTLVISIALRYIPHIAGLYGKIKSAHALRCGIHDKTIRKRRGFHPAALFPVLVSLMIQSVKTIPTLTMALELKGVGRDNRRTRVRSLPAVPRPGAQILCTFGLLVLLTLPLLL